MLVANLMLMACSWHAYVMPCFKKLGTVVPQLLVVSSVSGCPIAGCIAVTIHRDLCHTGGRCPESQLHMCAMPPSLGLFGWALK